MWIAVRKRRRRFSDQLRSLTSNRPSKTAFQGEIGSFQVTRKGNENTERIFRIRNYPIEEDGEITGVVAEINDVTERRMSERRLRAQKQRHQSLFESIHDAIVVADGGPGIPEMKRSVLSGEAAIESLYHGSSLGL